MSHIIQPLAIWGQCGPCHHWAALKATVPIMHCPAATILPWNNISPRLIKYFCSKPVWWILARSLVARRSLSVLVCAGIRYPGMCVTKVLKKPWLLPCSWDRLHTDRHSSPNSGYLLIQSSIVSYCCHGVVAWAAALWQWSSYKSLRTHKWWHWFSRNVCGYNEKKL